MLRLLVAPLSNRPAGRVRALAPRRVWHLLELAVQGIAERFVGTVRRELLDHVIVLNERDLRQLIESFVTYYNVDRTHIGVGKDSPCGRPVEQRSGAPLHLASHGVLFTDRVLATYSSTSPMVIRPAAARIR